MIDGAANEEPQERSYLDELGQNPAWQRFEEEITEQAVAMIQKLLAARHAPAAKDRAEQSLEAFALDLVSQIGEIRGVLRWTEEPVVIRRAIDARRDR